jgi:hypothetical protein
MPYRRWNIAKGDLHNAIFVSKGGDDVACAMLPAHLSVTGVAYHQRKGGPNIQHSPHWASGCAEKVQIQESW